jgi:hypothetical protein
MPLRLLVLAFLLLAPVLAYGQAGPAAGLKEPDAPSDAPTLARDGAREAHAPLPVTIYFKNGRKVHALLIRSTDDSFLAEIGGRRHSIDALTVEGLLFDTRRIDEYFNIRFNDEKARLDNYAIELQNDPTAKGYLICYERRRLVATSRCARAKRYIVNTRGIGAARFVTMYGGFRDQLTVEFWVAPFGSPAPVATPSAIPAPARRQPPPGSTRRPAARRTRRR